jgi:hypothetical protein
MVYNFARIIEDNENKAHPRLFQERLKLAKKARRLDKSQEDTKKDDDTNASQENSLTKKPHSKHFIFKQQKNKHFDKRNRFKIY